MIRVFAKVKSKAGCEDQLRPILEKLARSSRAESGVVTYELFEAVGGSEFLFREEYSSADAFEAHRRSRHVQVATARATQFMEGGLELWEVRPLPDDASRNAAG